MNKTVPDCKVIWQQIFFVLLVFAAISIFTGNAMAANATSGDTLSDPLFECLFNTSASHVSDYRKQGKQASLEHFVKLSFPNCKEQFSVLAAQHIADQKRENNVSEFGPLTQIWILNKLKRQVIQEILQVVGEDFSERKKL